MRLILSRIVIAVVFGAGFVALPLATAQAQYYPPPSYPACSPFPLSWPFCIIGAAATLVIAPFWLLAGAPTYPYGYYRPPYYPPPGYYPPPRYYPAPGYYAPGSSVPPPPSGQH